MAPSKPGGGGRTLGIIAVLLALAALGFFGWQWWEGQQLEPPAAVVEPAPSPPGPVLPEPAATPAPVGETELMVPAPLEAPPEVGEMADPCQAVRDDIVAFFERLDQTAFVRDHGVGDSQQYSAMLAGKLFARTPTVVRETDSLATIVENAAFFFRVLGKDDLLFLRELLNRESATIEETMALFYTWSEMASSCPPGDVSLDLPLAGLYEYAGFFLNTLGGRSYLFRRESRLRALVKYYSVLVLDRANDQNLNRYGLDIRPFIASSLDELRATGNLESREAYLDILAALQDKYKKLHGG